MSKCINVSFRVDIKYQYLEQYRNSLINVCGHIISNYVFKTKRMTQIRFLGKSKKKSLPQIESENELSFYKRLKTIRKIIPLYIRYDVHSHKQPS